MVRTASTFVTTVIFSAIVWLILGGNFFTILGVINFFVIPMYLIHLYMDTKPEKDARVITSYHEDSFVDARSVHVHHHQHVHQSLPYGEGRKTIKEIGDGNTTR